ncbi:MAG: hypothetical protein KBH30_06280 [Ferruginibacter sp.]|nr:hypothetical protein [Ferruginibacter sp.]
MAIRLIQPKKFFTIPPGTNAQVIRVMNEIKKRNERKEFVTKFAIQNGYPVWNKVLMGTSQKQYAHASLAGNSLDGVTDTTILIPFVMEGEFSVKGFIRATLNDSVSLSYSLAKDYKAYEEKLDNSKTASSAFAMLSMALNKIVFNEEYYKITNPKILSTDTAHIATQKIKLNEINFSITDSANMRYLILCSSFTQTQAVCGTPGAAVCSDEDGCDAGSCPTNSCHLVTTTTNICTGIDYPDILGSTGGGSTGEGGGSNGGGPIPYVYPCEGTQNNPAPFTATNNIEDPGDCPEPGEGDGWIPWQDEPQTPCEIAQNAAKKMDTLFNASKADSVLNTIPNLSTETKEKGFAIYQNIIINPFNPTDTSVTGYSCGDVQTGTDSSILIEYIYNPNTKRPITWLHTHNKDGYSAQSAKDIYELLEDNLSNSNFQGAFVAAADGSQYAITVTNDSLANLFTNTKSIFLDGAKLNETSNIGKAFKEAEKYFKNGDSTKTNYAYEMAMATVLKQFNAGVTLNKKDTNGNFKPIVVNTIIANHNKPKKKQYVQDCL